MTCKEYRTKAWEKLHADWGKPILIFFLINLLMGAVSIGFSFNVNPNPDNPAATIALVSFIGSLLSIIGLIITGPFTLSKAKVALSIARGEEYETNDVFFGFKNFLSAFLLNLINGIFIFLWLLLFIVPGIIKAISYSMSYYILHDNPDMDANDARLESMRIMEGHKMDAFLLGLSFIGWVLLSILTLGILFLWVLPYIEVTMAEFYESIRPITAKENEEAASLDSEASEEVEL